MKKIFLAVGLSFLLQSLFTFYLISRVEAEVKKIPETTPTEMSSPTEEKFAPTAKVQEKTKKPDTIVPIANASVIDEPVKKEVKAEEAKTKYEGTFKAQVTGYTSVETCDPTMDCVMSSGDIAHIGAVACPREIPLRTKVMIAGKTYRCLDRTHQTYDGRFDIFMGFGDEAHTAAINFGIQELDVTIEK